MSGGRLRSRPEGQLEQQGRGGACAKGRGVAIQEIRSSKPLRPEKEAECCLPDGTGVGDSAVGPTVGPASSSHSPRASARDLDCLRPLLDSSDEAGEVLIKFAADTKPEGLLIERRLKNILTG